MYRVFNHSKSLVKNCFRPKQLPGLTSSFSTFERDQERQRKPVELPKSADAVIIGGGVSGCSLMYHLAKLGMTNTLLLEKDDITAGTTWHTAGLVWHLRPSDIEVELLQYSRKLMESIEEETGINPGFIRNGGLFIASTKERLDEYQRLGSLGKVFGVESHVLNPKETKELYPLMKTDNLYGTLYSPMDGTIDPAGYCSALLRGATRAGAKVATGVSVNDVETYVDDFGTTRVKAVNTTHGRVETSCIVNCAGAWSKTLGKMAGVNVPLCAMRHAYVITDRIEGVQNMPNVRDHDSSVYLRLQGDALSIGGYENNPIFWDPVPEFAFSLFELDWDVFSVHINGAIDLVPAIESTGIKSTVCGPESFTPDHKPLMGESPEVRGFFLNCGYNSAGMMLSGGCGREMAKWLVNGRPDVDMFGYDIRRFTNLLTNNEKWIQETSHEAYAKNYAIVYPHDEQLSGRNQLKDPLYETLRDKGCFFQQKQGFERPGWFSDRVGPPLPYDFYGSYDCEAHSDYAYRDLLQMDYTFDFPYQHEAIRKECLACREGVAVFNMSYFGKYFLVGPDAEKFADWLFTANVQRPIGQTIYTCILNKNGGTESDLTVSVVEPGSGMPHAPQFNDNKGYYLAVGGAVSQYVSSFIRDIIQDEKWNCKLVDHSLDMTLLSVQGPLSRQVLQSLTDTELSNEAFPFSTHKELKIAGYPCRALRLTFVGEMGWELHIPNEFAVPVYKALMEAGAPYNITDAGYRAIDSLSLEKGYRHWHADIRSDDTPLEAGLAFACKMKTDIPFLGREALEKQKKEGLKKKVALFSLSEPVMLHGLEAILRDGQYVGHVRRAEYAHYVEKPLAYGYVSSVTGEPIKNDFLKSGEWEIERMGIRYPATVHLKSLFDPQNLRVKGQYEQLRSETPVVSDPVRVGV